MHNVFEDLEKSDLVGVFSIERITWIPDGWDLSH